MRLSELLIESSDNLSAGEIVTIVKGMHHSPEDLVYGNLSNRIYRFKNYVLREIPVSDLDLHQWNVDDDMAAEYAGMSTAMPPIVFDPIDQSIIDGSHRANAAALRGDATVMAYVGNDPDPDWSDDPEEEYHGGMNEAI